ncbi:uncharacterized protein LOC117328669 [Pecten maximus]|uniref:uncharacterized protein LOC117328669 n=1 Tax=Pecten maximus TaxID=6579 RepID=UPI00145822A1|nr:uncharacterized protein LOC117328669 [Pecten maximus]
MAVNHHNRQFHNFLKNNAHPYFSKTDRTSKSAANAPESSVLQGLSRLLMGCRSLYATSAGYYSPTNCHTFKAKTEPTSQHNNEMWVFRMSMQGFKSENVKISVRENTVLVQAKFDQDLEKEGSDRVYGMTRNIAIPDSVVREKVVGYLDEQQVLVIEAPYKDRKGQKDQVVPGLRRTSSSDLDDDELFNRPNFVFNQECEVPKQQLPLDQDRLSESSNDPFSIIGGNESCKNCKSNENVESANSTQGSFRLTINMQNVPSKYIQVSTKGRKLIVRCNIQRHLSGLSLKESYSTEYALPSNVDIEGVKCVRSDQGILTVTAPCLSTKERRIEIIENCC